MKRTKMTRKGKVEASKKHGSDWKRKAKGQALALELERVDLAQRLEKIEFGKKGG